MYLSELSESQPVCTLTSPLLKKKHDQYCWCTGLWKKNSWSGFIWTFDHEVDRHWMIECQNFCFLFMCWHFKLGHIKWLLHGIEGTLYHCCMYHFYVMCSAVSVLNVMFVCNFVWDCCCFCDYGLSWKCVSRRMPL